MNRKWTPKPDLPPPATEMGVWGWLYKNLFSSPFNTVLTLIGIGILLWTVPPFLQWAIFNASWEGKSRDACAHIAQNGVSGACWVFIKVRLKLFIYGFYPEAERWRVNLVFLLLVLGAFPILARSLFPDEKRKLVFGAAGTGVIFFLFGTGSALIAAGYLLSPHLLSRVSLQSVLPSMDGNPVFSIAWRWIFLFAVYPFLAYFLLIGDAFGLPYVATHQWGGLFLTLVVAAVGIGTSLPIGIMLALGRRSEMRLIRMACVGFIELVRGVPLVSVLFMASVMFPLFLPQGVNFDKLLRALVGVALFYAAYMAEVVRGGLQGIPKGQYEAAQALGWSYWKTMGLIILPQVLRLVIPGIVNNFLSLLKDTTLVAVIGLLDLLGITKAAMADADWIGYTKEAYVFAAAVFWIFCFSMSRYSMHLEKKYHVSYH